MAQTRAKRGARIKHERSAGGVVLKREQDAYLGLVIGRSTPRIWSLPKGHVEPAERMEDTAVREVREETGVAADIIASLPDIRYWFYANKVKHSKIVHFYLMRYRSGRPTPQVSEVDEAAWVALDELPNLLTHLNERRIIDAVREIVSQKSAAELGFI
jgi:8-oxo-dGTP pyrophosphatase MutT (NUDIX family)